MRAHQEQRTMEGTPRWWPLESLSLDARIGLRLFRKSPGFTAIAILTLALGIGANTAIFSAADGILIEPLPYANAGRMIEVEASGSYPEGSHLTGARISVADIRDIQAQCSAIGSEAAYSGDGSTGDMVGGSFPIWGVGILVSGNFFTALGVPPLLGRPILPWDTETGDDHAAVLSYGMWKDVFGADPKALGKTIWLKKQPYTVVGVMPRKFHIPPGVWRPSIWDLVMWVPFTPDEAATAADRNSGNINPILWLRPGATLRKANAQLRALSARLAPLHSSQAKGWRMSAKRETALQVGSALPTELRILLGAVGLVLLIACVNVSAMLLARSGTRHREVAIRAALGATRGRIVRQFLVESLLLSLAGGALGLLLAAWAIPVLRAIAPADTPRLDQLRLNADVLWFALGASVLSGIVFGVTPALAASGRKVGATLKEGVGGLLGGPSTRGPGRLRGALVVIEIALAVVLVTGATLVARSLQKMVAVPLGYRTEHVLTFQVALENVACPAAEPARCLPAAREILRRLRALPGVEAATLAAGEPLQIGYGAGVEVAGRAGPESSPVDLDEVMPGYFHFMGIPILAGRDFTDSDISDSPRVAIVNRAFAERFFPGANPLGQRISMKKDKSGHPEWMEIVGEVGDIRSDAITAPLSQEFYVPPAAEPPMLAEGPTLFLRTPGNPLALVAAVRQQVMAVNKDAPVFQPETFDQVVASEEEEPRFRAALLGTFGFLGLLLATVGIYGVISYSVSRRTREIGLRMALGAQPGNALAMVIREGMVLAATGIVIGIGGALALTRLLRSYLFEIKPTDPGTLVAVCSVLALAALAACYFPARRAAAVNPSEALGEQ